MIHHATPDAIAQAAQLLQQGDLVALPTETVYGLGADATNAAAVAKIYALKNRPSFNPLICHVADYAAAQTLAICDARADTLARLFWPGPLTLVLPQRADNGIDAIVTNDLPTIAVRVPSHPVAVALLRACGRPVAAPSANRSGTVSPTSALHVAHSFGPDAPFILAGGASTVGLESTIVDLSTPVATLLRPGSITRDDIEQAIGPIAVAGADSAIIAPGQLSRHYATQTPLRLNAVDVRPNEALLAFGSVKFMGAAGYGFAAQLPPERWRNLSPDGDLTLAAAQLFGAMRALDQIAQQQRLDSIAVMAIPAIGIGVAINDRLRRAATPDEQDGSS